MKVFIAKLMNLLESLMEEAILYLKAKRQKKESFVKMQSGIAVMNHSHGWNDGNLGYMAKDQGSRESHCKIKFDFPFEKTPNIYYALKLIDTGFKINQRIDLSIKDVYKDGFTMVFHTWEDSILYKCEASWIAYSE